MFVLRYIVTQCIVTPLELTLFNTFITIYYSKPTVKLTVIAPGCNTHCNHVYFSLCDIIMLC